MGITAAPIIHVVGLLYDYCGEIPLSPAFPGTDVPGYFLSPLRGWIRNWR
jgi:hypothetical protein